MINQHKLKTVRIQKINLLQSKIKILQILSQNSKTKYNNKSKSMKKWLMYDDITITFSQLLLI